MTKVDLQPRRAQIMQYITSYTKANGYCPSVREICSAVGLSSTSTVYGHLQRMQRDGLLTLAPCKPRTIVPAGGAEKERTTTHKLMLESDDGSVGFIVVPNMPDGFKIDQYSDVKGAHTVIRCTDCTGDVT